MSDVFLTAQNLLFVGILMFVGAEAGLIFGKYLTKRHGQPTREEDVN